MIKRASLILSIMLVVANGFAQQNQAMVEVNLAKEKQEMKPIWAWFGYDEPNYTYMKDGKKLLSEISALSPVPVFVRTHSLLVTGDGIPDLKWGSTNAYTEDAQGNPIYNWAIIDSIFDTYVKRGMKPLAQIGFMPEALSTHPDPYLHHWKPGDPYNDIYTGWAYPPKDYNKWAELVYQWVKHSVDRYGKKEVESWYWELWNEPNSQYWKGTPQEFFKLYDYSATALKRALPTARIGGANITGGGTKFLEDFIKHCLFEKNEATGKIGTPLEVLLFHAKGSPKVVNGKVVMNVSNQLNNVNSNLKMIAGYPQLKNVPIVIGESDPEGCAACGMKTDPQNAYRNGTMYSSYTAASFARVYELAQQYQLNLIGAVTWAFEFENQPWFYGYRDLATNGVDKPVLNVFRMFGKMGGNFVEATSSQMYPLQTVLDSSIRKVQNDIGVLAAKQQHEATVMIWNYHDEDRQGDSSIVKLQIKGIPAQQVKITHYRIDEKHSNSYSLWQQMGSPQQPTQEQIKQLERAGELAVLEKPKPIKIKNGNLETRVMLPNQAVSLLKLEW
ncbi:MAG: beta-xylosidase [Pelobium sp.]